MDRALIERVIREAYRARASGDLDATCTFFTDDARFAVAGDPQASPVAGSVTGCAGIREVLAGLIAAVEFVRHDIVELVVEDDRAAVHSRLTVRGRASGEEVETEFLDLVHLRDGKIASFVQFCDTARAASLVAPRG